MRLNHLFSSISNFEMKEKSALSHKISEFFSSTFFLIDLLLCFIFSGVHGGAKTLVPFPNTIVKGSSGDGTVNLTMGE